MSTTPSIAQRFNRIGVLFTKLALIETWCHVYSWFVDSKSWFVYENDHVTKHITWHFMQNWYPFTTICI